MIKKFKEFINETLWGDMMDRSSGIVTRKEDDINLLDCDGLYDYIKSKYKEKAFYIDKDSGSQSCRKYIVVDIINSISLYAKYIENDKIDNILLSWTGVNIKMPFFNKLKERFDVQITSPCRRVIKELDGTCTNQTYIDVLDFFIENKNHFLRNDEL